MHICGKCGENGCTPGKRYCSPCHAEYMREWRKRNPLTDEQRKKDNARSMAGIYKKRGKLKPEPCKSCGVEENIEMHHEDYDRPLDVVWLCRKCHLSLHRSESKMKAA
jgi:hypothetical protein